MYNQEARIKFIKACATKSPVIIKDAGMGEQLADMLTNSIKDLIDPNNIVTSILQLGLEGLIGAKFGFMWSIFVTVLDKVFGINVKNLFKLITGNVGGFLKSSPDIASMSSGTLDAVASKLTNATLSTAGIDSNNANIPIQTLAEKSTEATAMLTAGIIKDAQAAGFLAKLSIGSLIKSIITALLRGAAASMSVSAVQQSGNLSNKPATNDEQVGGSGSSSGNTTSTMPAQRLNPTKSVLKRVGNPSGKGEVSHVNDASINDDAGNKSWYITSSGNFTKTMFNWVVAIYPDMPENIETKIYDNFIKAARPVRDLFSKWNSGIDIDSPKEYIRVPSNFTTQKQIVDTILSAIA